MHYPQAAFPIGSSASSGEGSYTTYDSMPWIGVNNNEDTATLRNDADFNAFLATEAGQNAWLQICRESASSTPVGTTSDRRPSYASFFAGGGAWLADYASAFTWSSGRKLYMEPLIQKLARDSGTVWNDSEQEERVKWRICQFLNKYAGKDTLFGFEGPNEPDNKASEGAWADIMQDYSSMYTSAAVTEGTRRMKLMAKWIREQVKATNMLTGITNDPSNALVCGPALAFPSSALSDSNQFYLLSDLLADGEYKEQVDAITYHNHNQCGTSICDYANTKPRSTVYSPQHIWDAIQGSSGKTEMPIFSSETGVALDRNPGTYGDAWQLCAWRYANGYGGHCWYGVSTWLTYTTQGGPWNWRLITDSPYSSTALWEAINYFANNDKFKLSNYTPTFVTKDYTEFWKNDTWSVYFTQLEIPTVVTGNPFSAWSRVTFSGGTVTLAPGARNLIWRNVIFPNLKSRQVIAKVHFTAVNANAKAKLRLRGYNKLNGLEAQEFEVIGTTTDTQTLTLSFTPSRHGITTLPDNISCLLAIDHNGTGTLVVESVEISGSDEIIVTTSNYLKTSESSSDTSVLEINESGTDKLTTIEG